GALAGNAAFFSETVSSRLLGADKDVKQYLADLLVQYAGALAVYDIEQPFDGVETTDVRKGVLALSDDRNVLSIDLSSVLWKDALNGNKVDPIDAEKFREVFFEKAAGDALTHALRSISIGSADGMTSSLPRAGRSQWLPAGLAETSSTTPRKEAKSGATSTTARASRTARALPRWTGSRW